MPEFIYTARTPEGRSRNGTLLSAGMTDALNDLRGRGWIVLEVQAARNAAGVLRRAAFYLNPVNWLPATRFDVEMGLQQMATMIRGGLTLLASLKTASEQVRRSAMRRVWLRIYERIESGESFADSLASERNRFSPMVVQLVRVGESSGTLDIVLTRAAEHLEKSRAVRATLFTALMYPAFVLAAAVGVTGFMVVEVIPKLQQFIASRGRRLPAVTQTLLNTTNWLNAHLTIILLTAAIIVLATWILYRIQQTRIGMDTILLRLPLIGGLLRLAGTAAASRGLSLLLENGVNLLDAIQISEGLLSNRAMRRRLDSARQSVMEGGTLTEGLLAGREFLPMLGRMTAVGEQTGTLDSVLAEVARFHESQLASAVRRFSLLIEPVVILIVGGIVGFVYIAFFMALFAVAS
jgi:type IV pilus assembly protein PilC